MAEIYTVGTFEQIETILSKLANNYSEIARLFYDIFYNNIPGDYEIQLYDDAGNLQTYIIPNRAKDRAYILNGNGNPEGTVAADVGSIYQDLTDGTLYIKKHSNDNQGWVELISQDELENTLIQGFDSPEGVQEAVRGTLYIDTSNASLYIKTTPTGKSGWKLIAVASNLMPRYIVEKGEVDGNWYVLYSDGWCEQGGSKTGVGTSNVTVNFPKSYSTVQSVIASGDKGTVNVVSKTSTNIVVKGSTAATTVDWVAYGYVA